MLSKREEKKKQQKMSANRYVSRKRENTQNNIRLVLGTDGSPLLILAACT